MPAVEKWRIGTGHYDFEKSTGLVPWTAFSRFQRTQTVFAEMPHKQRCRCPATTDMFVDFCWTRYQPQKVRETSPIKRLTPSVYFLPVAIRQGPSTAMWRWRRWKMGLGFVIFMEFIPKSSTPEWWVDVHSYDIIYIVYIYIHIYIHIYIYAYPFLLRGWVSWYSQIQKKQRGIFWWKALDHRNGGSNIQESQPTGGKPGKPGWLDSSKSSWKRNSFG